MDRRVWRALALVAGLAALLAASVPAHAAKKSRADRRLQTALERVVEAKKGPPGAMALLHRGRKTTFLRVGVGTLKRARPWRRDSHMRLASVSKAFNGAVALALVDRGTMSLDDTVGSRLPSMPVEWHAATLRQLLSHTSGIPNMTEDPGYLDAFANDLLGRPTPLELIGFMKEHELNFDPGTSYKYSNTENILAALMAEQAAGKSYEELLSELVFEPLRMERTALPRGPRLPRPRVEGYDVGPPLENLTECCSMAWLWSAGGLYSTPRELDRFTRAFVGGRLFGGEARRAQFQFVPGVSEPPVPGRISAGLGLFRYRTGCGPVFGHTGNVFGYTQFTVATRNGRRSATVSVNDQLSPDSKPRNFKPLARAFRLAACALRN